MPTYPHLKRLKIPFRLLHTDEFIKSMMRIAAAGPFLNEYLGSPLELKLHRRAKVRAITYSNQIEGNPLGEEEVTVLLKEKRIAGAPPAVREVQNYHTALDYVEQLAQESRSLRLADFCDIQRLVTAGLIPEKQSGRIRTVPVSVVNAADKTVIEECPAPYELKGLLDDLWQWLDDTQEANAFARAFAFHFIAVAIHPFADGNGRTVRLMQHLLLLKGGESIARFVPSETTIMKQRARYYSAIRQSRALNALPPIVEFLAECFAVSAEEVVLEGKALLRNSATKTPSARYGRILALAKKIEHLTMRDVINLFPDVPRRTLERDLETLTKERALKAHGEKKARTYRPGANAGRYDKSSQ